MINSKKFNFLVIVVAVFSLALGQAADIRLRSQYSQTHPKEEAASFLYGATASADPNWGLKSDLGPVELVWKVLDIIKNTYVDPVDPFNNTEMSHNAVRYMVTSLGDPESKFLDRKDIAIMADLAQGKFHGTGIVTAIRPLKRADWTDQQLTVIAALPGSPASKVGILPGDIVDEVNGKWVMSHDPVLEAVKVSKDFNSTRMQRKQAFDEAKARREKAISVDEAVNALTDSTGTISLVLDRGGKKVKIAMSLPGETRAVVKAGNEDEKIEKSDMPITSAVQANTLAAKKLEHGVGYVSIAFLSTDVPGKLQEALEKFKSESVNKVVLDLRNCAGGSVSVAQSVAGMIAPGKSLGFVLRQKGQKDTLAAKSTPIIGGLKIVILVNEGTRGSAELLAAGLRDILGVRVIGQTTWGSGLERSFFRLSDGYGYTLSTGKFLTPKGNGFNNTGVKPDAIVPMTPTGFGSASDVQLQRAVVVVKRPSV